MNSCNNSFVVSNNCSDPTTNCELRPSNSFRFSTRIEYNKSQHFASPPNNNLESPAFVKLLGVFTWYLIIIYFTTQNGIMYSCFVITSIILVKKSNIVIAACFKMVRHIKWKSIIVAISWNEIVDGYNHTESWSNHSLWWQIFSVQIQFHRR